jgi:hypothetical protein
MDNQTEHPSIEEANEAYKVLLHSIEKGKWAMDQLAAFL